jgi:hypothetical protein
MRADILYSSSGALLGLVIGAIVAWVIIKNTDYFDILKADGTQPISNPQVVDYNQVAQEAQEANEFVDNLENVDVDEDMFQLGVNTYIDTVQGTMKNPNLQLRQDPPVTMRDTGPWNQGTIPNYVQRKALGC